MSGVAHNGAYGQPGAGAAPWADGPPWAAMGPFNPWTMPKPFLLLAMVLGFILFWPVGLAVLFFGLGSGRFGRRWRRDRWQGAPMSGQARGCGWRGWARDEVPSSGNRAFDDYRVETLRRLEEEQQEFSSFLDRLRVAKDKAEFDQFMAERRPRRPGGEAPQDGEGRA